MRARGRLTIRPSPAALRVIRAGRALRVTIVVRFVPGCGPRQGRPVRLELAIGPDSG